VFPTCDGHINIAASSTRHFERLCDVLGRPEWKERPEWRGQSARRQQRAEINAAIGDITRTRPSAEWISALDEAGIPCGPIYSIDQVFADEQVQHLGMATPMHRPAEAGGDTLAVASPLNFSGLSRQIRQPTPEPGSHTDEVLRSVGYSDSEIADWRARGIV
jgi:formyl-CoA transferase